MNRPLIVWYLYDKFILFSFDRAMFVESFWTSEQIPPETPTEAISEQQPQQPCGVWLVLVCVCVFFLMLGALFVCISSFPHESDQQSMWPFPGEQGSQAVALRRPGDACLDAGSATLENKWNIVSLQMDNLTVSMSVLVRQTTSFLCWFFPKNSSSMFPHPH